jgi:hypothetical protein
LTILKKALSFLLLFSFKDAKGTDETTAGDSI